ncbi:MAG: membrane protein insertase YidC [Candidatus Ornithospirochaeta sp.]|nr:membrane protein insertase YidC [Spirochaetales bacterium]
MDRNTIIAVILCVIVITVGMAYQQTLLSNEFVETETTEVTENIPVPVLASSSFSPLGSDGDSSPFNISSGSLDITFNPKGGTIESIYDKTNDVNLILTEEGDNNAFMLYWGKDKSSPIDDVFDYSVETKEIQGKNENITQVAFSRSYKEETTGTEFVVEKKFAVPENDEYMIQMAVSLYTKDGSPIPINIDSQMYTVSVGSQVGPEFQSLNGNYDYRRVYYRLADKNSRKTVNSGNFTSSDSMGWAGVVGKYFAFLLIPETQNVVTLTEAVQTTGETIPQKNTIYMSRAASGESKTTDVYSFYCGPQLSSTLGIYDNAKDNVFGLSNHHLKKALDVSWLSWLEKILKVLLEVFYFLIPNYGVAIILLTILTKALLIPLSKKGTESTAKMSALQPKLQELQTKYKDDPEALNNAMAKLYKEEGINPMGSCWPMLIQFPIFIGLYGLLNKDFSLRGAMFIPGWITDLSIPETIFTLPFNIPFLGAQIHLLPILYTASMIFSMKITQSATSGQAAGSKGMTWFMTYGMSIMFFFILYNAPSGLLVYWTMSNLLAILQQVYTNKKTVAGFKKEIEEKDAAKAQKKAAAKKRNRK